MSQNIHNTSSYHSMSASTSNISIAIQNIMSQPKSHCPHINIVGDYTKEDIIAKQNSVCDTCKDKGPNLWVCLHRNCLYVGCNDSGNNHCVKHFEKENVHSLFLNLTLLRVYCLLCDCEVFLENNDPPIPGMLPNNTLNSKVESDSEEDCDFNEENIKPRGLTGLQNLGNTCYMNSAIQALSNCPQLTNFFLDCGPFVRSENKPGLSKSYSRLMREMWHKKRPSYVVPSGIAYGIKIVFPVFRGYTQQDAQEFLRCFMDQLHEELKEPLLEPFKISPVPPDSQDGYDNIRADSGLTQSEDSSQSDVDYETCDSVISSEKGSCIDEGIESQDNTELFNELFGSVSLDSVESISKPLEEIQPAVHNSSNHLWDSEVHTKDSSVRTPSKCDIDLPSDEGHSEIVNNDDDVFLKENRNATYQIKDSDLASNPKQSKSTNLHSVLENKTYESNPSSFLNHISSNSIINSVFNIKSNPKQYRSIISDTFDGKLLSSVQCLTCDTVSTTKETFQDLSLPIPNRDHLHLLHATQGNHQKIGGTCSDVYSHQGWFSAFFGWIMSWFWGLPVSLQDCLAAFFSADELKGDNMYSCEKCKKLRNGIKYSKVIELPEMLCIHLKRFRHEVMFSSKIGNYVSFPLEGLDMSPFVHKCCPQSITTYDLTSVICHHGTAGSGHYTAYCLNYLNDQWYEFDDQYVTAVDPEMVRHCEAYVLFYRKSSEEMIKKRLCAVELIERCRNEHGLLKFRISKQWINRFNYFADPGPITNYDFLCIHGGVPPQKATYAEDLCTVLSQSVWEYLYETFKGGPPCTHLYVCSICQAELDSLNHKRKKELENFLAMKSELQDMENMAVLYAISMSWFKNWENFVCKENDPPGPIDNSGICYVKNNQAILKLGSDYCSVSKEIYHYLLSIYGGGPDLIIHGGTKSNVHHSTSENTKNRLNCNHTPNSQVPSTIVQSVPKTISSSQMKYQYSMSNKLECSSLLATSPPGSEEVPQIHWDASQKVPCLPK